MFTITSKYASFYIQINGVTAVPKGGLCTGR